MEKDKILARSVILDEKLFGALQEIDSYIYRLVDMIIEENEDKIYIPFAENPAKSVYNDVPMYLMSPLRFVHIIGLTSDGCLVLNYNKDKDCCEAPAVIAGYFAEGNAKAEFFKHSVGDLVSDFLDVNHSMLLSQLIDFAMKGEKSGK